MRIFVCYIVLTNTKYQTLFEHADTGGVIMSEREQNIVSKLAAILPLLPTEKQEYLLGYADAIVDMTSPQPQTQPAAQDVKS